MKFSSLLTVALVGTLWFMSVGSTLSQDLYVGSNSSGQTLTLAASSSNSFSNTYVGFSPSDSNNQLTVIGANTLLTNSANLFVGNNGGINNTLVISNGAIVSGADVETGLMGSNNLVLVTGLNSTLTSRNQLYAGDLGSGNSLIVTNGGSSYGSDVETGVGGSYNSIVVSGTNSILSSSQSIYVGRQTYSYYQITNDANWNSLVISNGASASGSDFEIGRSGNGNLIVVTGPSSRLTSANQLYVGGQNSYWNSGGNNNSLVISDGAFASGADITAGIGGSYNSIVVTGTNTIMNGANDISIGLNNANWNSLVISNGATAISSEVSVGNSGDNNSITVTGTSSKLISSGKLLVGFINLDNALSGGNNNSLVVSDGGFVSSVSTSIGVEAGGHMEGAGDGNWVLITGAGSLLSNSGTFMIGGDVIPGYIDNAIGGSGTLTIAKGGSLISGSVIIASGVNTIGTLNVGTIGGSDSNLTLIAANIALGSGKGSLNFNQADSIMVNASISITNTNSSLNLLGSGTTILSGSNIDLSGLTTISKNASLLFAPNANDTYIISGGISGSGSLGYVDLGTTILSGSNNYTGMTSIANGTLVAASSNALGASPVSLSGGTLSVQTNLYISSLVWNSGASLALSNLTNAITIDLTGTLTLTGSGTNIINLARYRLNDIPTKIFSAGAVANAYTTNNFSIVGLGTNYTLSFSNNALWISGFNLFIGSDSTSDSRSFISGTNAFVDSFVGYTPNASNNLLTVSGSDTLLHTSADLFLGYSGNRNSLVVSNGGMVNNYDGWIGYSNGASSNSAIVTGSNSSWTNYGDLIVGAHGPGNNLLISNGGIVANSQSTNGGVIGLSSGSSNNSVLVTDANSLWTNYGDLIVGAHGSANNLVISNAGTVVNNQFSNGGVVGLNSDSSNNSVIVTDTNSLWRNGGDLIVGVHGSGNSLLIYNGGTVVNNQFSNGGVIGLNSDSSNNAVLVAGPESSWINNSDLKVGYAGSGNSLVISNGGMVVDSNGWISFTNSALKNSVLVTGTNSLWNNSGQLVIGNLGSGMLTIANGSTVAAAGITIAASSGSGGTLNIGALGGHDTAGLLDTPSIAFSSVGSSLNLNQIDTTTISSIIVGNGFINQLGSGTTILTGGTFNWWVSPFSGLTTISNGVLQFGDGVTAGTAVGTGSFSNNASLVFNPTSTDTYTVSGVISGSGSLSYIGSGTTILSGSNSYTGTTAITNGTLVAASTNALGTSAVDLSGGTLSLQTPLNVSSLSWNSSVLLALPNLTNGDSLNVTGMLKLTGSAPHLINLTGNVLGDIPTELVSGGGLGDAYTTSNFAVFGLGFQSYALSFSNNALWIAGLDLYVGSTSTVTPTNFNSGTNGFVNTYVGFSTNASNNLLTVGGAGTILTSSADFTVGCSGSGNSLVISNAGMVANNNGWIGYSNGASSNFILVAGAGSLWKNNADLTVGYAGSGNSLVISNAGMVANSNGWVGYANGASNNFVLVTGSNSLWSNNGLLAIGVDGSGNSLVISNGGTVAHNQLTNGAVIGLNSDSSNNSVLVTGKNSFWTNSGNLFVGFSGSSNSLVISNGGTVMENGANWYYADNSESSIIGQNADSSNNSVIVIGSDSLWTNTGDLTIGYSGSGNSLLISNGGMVANNNGCVGSSNSASNNFVLVTGSNSLWSNSGVLTIGVDGSGNSLVISNGGTVIGNQANSDFGPVGSGIIGTNADSSNNSVLVTGPGSHWINKGDLIVGVNGSGNDLMVSNGGSAAGVDVKVGDQGNDNSIFVTGTNSSLINSGQLYVGSGNAFYGNLGNSNSLVISNGATASGGDVEAGNQGNDNSILVTGINSSLTSTNQLYVGSGVTYFSNGGNGNTLVISNGATASGGDVEAGNQGNNNSILVTGTNSTLTSTNQLYIGHGGYPWYVEGNSLVISNGASASGGDIEEGFEATNNTILVTGTNSTLTSSTQLLVGAFGGGNSLLISNGATASGADVEVGTSGNNNTITVTGVSSILSSSGQLYVGNGGTGNSLLISNGATASGVDVVVGNKGGNTNIITVSGLNSSLVSSGQLYIGNGIYSYGYYGGNYNGVLVSNGGTITSRNACIGSESGSDNWVLITGSGSVWSNAAAITLGGKIDGVVNTNDDGSGGSGTLTIGNAGAVITGSVIIGSGSNTMGTLNIGTFGGSDRNASLSTTNISFGLGIGTLNFNQADTMTLAANITSASDNVSNSVNQLGTGTTILTGSNSYSGLTVIGSGALQLGNGGSSVIFGNSAISNNASLILNSSGDFSLAVNISGTGSLSQIGTGTTTISGNNSYSGATFLSSGTIVAGSTSALGSSAVNLSGGTLALQTNPTISSLNWNSSATLSLSNITNWSFLNVSGALSLTGASTHSINLTGYTLSAIPKALISAGSLGGDYTTNNFSIFGLSNNYSLSFNNDTLWIIGDDLIVGNNFSVSATNFTSGTNAFLGSIVGLAANASNNLLTVSGPSTLLTNSADLVVGYSGSGNSMVVSNGGVVANNTLNNGGVIGFNSGSSNNSVLVTGVGSLWTNSGSLFIGNSGSGSLTLANGGTVVAAGGITIAASIGSAGTLNFASLGGSDTSGFLSAPTIVFGRGSGTINLNQVDTVTISAAISDQGNGLINQLGSGTTILTGNNSGFLGLTTISNGTLQFGNGVTEGAGVPGGNFRNGALLVFDPSTSDTYLVSGSISGSGTLSQIGSGTTIISGSSNSIGKTIIANGTLETTSNKALGTGSVSLFDGSILLQTNLNISSLIWNTAGTVALPNLAAGSYLNVKGELTLTGSGSDIFNLSGDILGSSPVELLSWGSLGGAYTTNNFSVDSLSAYSLSIRHNALWVAGLNLYVGNNSSFGGTNFTSGTNAFVNTYVGFTKNASNHFLTVSGANTLLTNLDTLTVGYSGSSNSMVVSNGGIVANNQLKNGGVIGLNRGSSDNSVLVTGAGSLWSNSGNLTIGFGGSDNSLVISNGGTVVNNQPTNFNSDILANVLYGAAIGLNVRSSNNTVVVTGPNSTWTDYGILDVGNKGSHNSLVISNGGSISCQNALIIGDWGITSGGPANSNTVTVAGTNSSLSVNGDILVSFDANTGNRLIVTNGGSVTASNLYVTTSYHGPYPNSSNNSVLVTGPGSSVNLPGNLYIGQSGHNDSLVVSNGATVSGADVESGISGYNNSITVSGTNSSLSSSDQLYVGKGETGNTLVVSGGATVSGADVETGLLKNNNSITVTGSNSSLTSSGQLYVGNGSSTDGNGNIKVYYYSGKDGAGNSLVVSNGATVSGVDVEAGIYRNNNTITVTGANSSLTSSGLLYVGSSTYLGGAHSNAMVISNGGSAFGGDVEVGVSGNNNSITVIGSNSSLTSSGQLYVGSGDFTLSNGGSGNRLVISNGASASGADIEEGVGYANNNNAITVTGINSSLISSGQLYIGIRGVGNTLVVSNGATVSGSDVEVGQDGNNNSITITGTNSQFTSSGQLYIGKGSFPGYPGGVKNDRMVVSKGGMVSSFNAFIGAEGASRNSVLVTGAGSLWSNAAAITLGGSLDGIINGYDDSSGGSGTLTIGSGGTVISPNVIIGSGINTMGTLDIGILGGKNTNVALNALNILFGPGTGTMNFNQSDTTTLAAAISGFGTLNQRGTGTTLLTGSNSYTGGTRVSSGTLAGTTASLQGTITNNASLVFNQGGSGTFTGPIRGSGKVSVTGSGSVTLSGTNSYRGGTTVTLGNLAASSLGSGALLIKPSAGKEASFTDTLGSGTLTLGAITLSGASSINIENPYASIHSLSAVTIIGDNNFISLSGAWTNLGTYSLITGTKVTGSGLKALELTGSFLGDAFLTLGQSTSFGGFDYTFTNTATALDLKISGITPEFSQLSLILPDTFNTRENNGFSVEAVPEGSTTMLLVMGILALVLAYRRKDA